MKGKFRFAEILLIILFIITNQLYAQSGNVAGRVFDSIDDSPLWGTNIIVAGTSIGTATDLDGKYRLSNVPVGSQVIVFRYLGYKSDSVNVEVVSGRTLQLDHEMSPQVIEGEEVLVTAQLQGQVAAINQQLTSNTIVNVVSADKIQELPDQNAAESLGRLPGVSIQRDAGEGQKVVVRGLAPKYNSITINGERIPATGGDETLFDDEQSGYGEDRSVDLSMISPDVIAGIEVFKAITPDQDADAIGGSINLSIKKAPENFRATVRLNNTFNNHEEDLGLYKGSFTASNRLFDNQLGVIATGSIQRANRGSDVLDAGYDPGGIDDQGLEIIDINSVNLIDRFEIRDRYSASLTLDYQMGNSSFLLSNFWGRTDREEVRRRRQYRLGTGRQRYDIRDREVNINLFSTGLSADHNLDFMTIDWRASYSQTSNETPFSLYSRFRENAAFSTPVDTEVGPDGIPPQAKDRLEQTWFKEQRLETSEVSDKDLTLKVDFKMPFRLGTDVSGFVKTGAKFKKKDRERDNDRLWTNSFGINDLGEDIAKNPDDFYRTFELTDDSEILVTNFFNNGIDRGNYLEGSYEFGNIFDDEQLRRFYNEFKNDIFENDDRIDIEDYQASEEILAGYFMAEINFGKQFMLLPGLRYEKTTNDYKSVFGNPIDNDELDPDDPAKTVFTDTTGGRFYENFLPMVHFRYKFAEWGDLRLSYTESLARPNYFQLVPFQRIDFFSATVERGDPNLKPTEAINYDVYFSFYNQFGLLTIGAFYKELNNVDYIRESRVVDPDSDTNGFSLTAPENALQTTFVRGLEVDIQANLRFLPDPFDGIILGANITKISSNTVYPLLIAKTDPNPPFQAILFDSTRSGRMIQQPDFLANFTIGYERGGFSGRISFVFQGKSLDRIGRTQLTDSFTEDYNRWDLALQQEVWNNISVFVNINNFTNRPEKSSLGSRNLTTNEQFFGWTGDLGIKYKL